VEAAVNAVVGTTVQINITTLLGLLSPISGVMSALVALYVGKQVADLRIAMLLDAQQREQRVGDKIDALTVRVNERLDTKADKAGHVGG
jgi:hypothetical protein